MTKFDPHASWKALQERADITDNPKHKALLQEVANHMEAEITGQLEPLMATLDPDPIYHFWRVGGENMVLQGYEAVAGFYSNMFATGGQQFQVVCDRIFVDDGGVITEGQVRQIYKTETLSAMGLTLAPNAELSSSELWMSHAQLITVWPAAADNKLMGEDIYFGEDPMQTLIPIAKSDLPEYYDLR